MLKESKYVRLANTMYRVLRNSRIPLFLHRKSYHVFTMWQHLVLLTIRQYEGKSYRMFVERLIEAYYLRLFLGLSRIPHFTTLQKFTDRISNSLLEKIVSSFIVISGTQTCLCRNRFNRVQDDSSQYYTERTHII
ncbi:MAG: transposase [Nitrososphaeraceae archaeon]